MLGPVVDLSAARDVSDCRSLPKADNLSRADQGSTIGKWTAAVIVQPRKRNSFNEWIGSEMASLQIYEHQAMSRPAYAPYGRMAVCIARACSPQLS